MTTVQNSVWPIEKFSFVVEFGGMDSKIHFQEVTGLDSETQPIEYRAGDNKAFATIKMPGIQKHGNITLKKGVFIKDNAFWDWFNTIKMNTIKRQTVKISLVDDSGAATIAWVLSNAWPTKISGTDLKETDSEVGVETIELAHEGIKIV